MLDFMLEWFCITWHDQIHNCRIKAPTAFISPQAPCPFPSTLSFHAIAYMAFYTAVCLSVVVDGSAVILGRAIVSLDNPLRDSTFLFGTLERNKVLNFLIGIIL